MGCCPLCGSKAELDFSVRLETNSAFIGPNIIALAPREAEILQVVLDAWPNRIMREDVFRKVWGSFSNVNCRTVSVLISKMNEKLIQFGYLVQNTHGSRSGYLLTKVQPMTAGEYRGKQRGEVQIQRLETGAKISARSFRGRQARHPFTDSGI